MKSRLSLVVMALILPGCAAGPDFKRPDPQLPARWSPAAASNTYSSEPQAVVQWWSTFQEPMLSSLIERSTASNLDLRAAVLRITEARAQREVAAAAFLPT